LHDNDISSIRNILYNNFDDKKCQEFNNKKRNIDKDKIKEINKLMNEVLNITKEYKNINTEDLKEEVIKQIKILKIF